MNKIFGYQQSSLNCKTNLLLRCFFGDYKNRKGIFIRKRSYANVMVIILFFMKYYLVKLPFLRGGGKS